MYAKFWHNFSVGFEFKSLDSKNIIICSVEQVSTKCTGPQVFRTYKVTAHFIRAVPFEHKFMTITHMIKSKQT